jgi:cyclopropane fatty-acyl-phospholipid synthase-like methyltransferase
MTAAENQAGAGKSAASEELTMGSIEGKLTLALVRGSDYAHAGEEEAIDLVLEPLTKSPETLLLDVGCGIGGTAHYVEDHGWGKVTGVDLDPANITAAKQRHPGIEFICSDAVLLEERLSTRFDVLYSFNAFFLFTDKPAALKAMRAVARPGAALAIFDYVDLGGYDEWHQQRKTPGMRHALELDAMEEMLRDGGWRLDRIVTLHADYLRWYESLVTSIESMREAIIAQSNESFYEFVHTRYAETLEDARAGRLGGATIYASAS